MQAIVDTMNVLVLLPASLVLVVLAGGGALLRGLVDRFREDTGMPVKLAPEPLQAVAEGSGKCLEEFEALKRVLISTSRH